MLQALHDPYLPTVILALVCVAYAMGWLVRHRYRNLVLMPMVVGGAGPAPNARTQGQTPTARPGAATEHPIVAAVERLLDSRLPAPDVDRPPQAANATHDLVQLMIDFPDQRDDLLAIVGKLAEKAAAPNPKS
jgi:hypothetical protein